MTGGEKVEELSARLKAHVDRLDREIRVDWFSYFPSTSVPLDPLNFKEHPSIVWHINYKRSQGLSQCANKYEKNRTNLTPINIKWKPFEEIGGRLVEILLTLICLENDGSEYSTEMGVSYDVETVKKYFEEMK